MEVSAQTKIQLLPEHIIDQIKAGEVIERPSTLIKEIIENSIDAKSTRIDLHLKDNGLELISLIDNGSGIRTEDLPLAFCRHATSKIDRFEDIYHLHSYGFRGEALASIASISKVTCESQTKETLGLIKIEGGLTVTHQEENLASSKTGTKIFIKDLFFNTPVRMKFIQSKTSEKNQLKKIINAFLLTHPEIEFSIKWDESEKDFYPKREDIKQRIKDVLFKNKNITFFECQSSYDGVNCKIILTNESTRGNAHKSHYLFINERFVQDFQIHRIILNTAKSLWPEGETGNYIAFVDVPADEVDVNIHPNKTVVKLFRAPKVYSVVSGSLKHSLHSSEVQKPKSSEQLTTELPLQTDNASFKSIDYKQVDFSQENVVNNYFDDLHKQEKTIISNAYSPIYSNNNLSLYSFKDDLFILNKHDIIKSELRKVIENKNLGENNLPLLVSRPIKLTQPLNSSVLELLQDLGFELDQLNESTLVLRSFPQELQRFSYLKIADFIISNQVTEKSELNFEKFELDEVNETHISDIIESIGFHNLILEKLIFKISNKELSSLYAKKK